MLLILVLLLLLSVAVAQEPANYGASCTPQTNPFLDNGPPSVTHPPPAGCGACVYVATCQRMQALVCAKWL
jgi:hypothetical protein